MNRSKDGLSRTARNQIRYKLDGSDRAIARKFGITEAMVREIRASGQPDNPAHVAALARRGRPKTQIEVSVGGGGGGGRIDGTVTRYHVLATVADAPKGQLHTEGGVNLPQPLG